MINRILHALTDDELLMEEVRLTVLIRKLSKFKPFGTGERARAIGSLNVINNETRRRAIAQ